MGKQATAKRIPRCGWRQWSAVDARKVLVEWRASGLALGTFARRRRLNDTRLRWWRRRLGEWDGAETPPPTPTPAFIPAMVRGVAVESQVTGSAPVRLRLPGGLVVEVADAAAVSPEWLAALVSELSRAR